MNTDRIREGFERRGWRYPLGRKPHCVKHIISHANCPDGYASAMILGQAFQDARRTFHHYNDGTLPEPAEGQVFVDFSPPPEKARAYLDAGAFVLDHHKGAAEVTRVFEGAGQGLYADNEGDEHGVSGAMLALLALPEGHETHARRYFARLIGVRDTWQRGDEGWEEACQIASALIFRGPPATMRGLGEDVDWDLIESLVKIGTLVQAERKRLVQNAVDHAFIGTTPAGTVFAVFDGYSLSSDAAEKLDADLVCGLVTHATPGKIVVRCSCRTRKGYQVLALAKAYGGGGHENAASFTLGSGGAKHPADMRHPFHAFQRALEAWEETSKFAWLDGRAAK